MKLSELVAYRNELNAWSANDIKRESDLKLDIIMHLVKSQSIQLNTFSTQLEEKYAQIQSRFDDFEIVFDQIKQSINNLIAEAEKSWFQASYQLHKDLQNENTSGVFNHRLTISTEIETLLRARILIYSDWKCSGMIVRPGLEPFIKDMVSFDPLYLLDQTYDLLSPAILQFPVQYQQRLRPYIVNEYSSDDMLTKIPNNQFGICLIYNFFNYRPLEIIKKYLSELYLKLRPGGVLIMTFNDCDRKSAVELVERHYASYTPGYLIKDLVQTLGFEISFIWNDSGPMTWLEIKKPGQFVSLRGGQTLAKIKEKNILDTTIKKMYTKHEILIFRNTAIKLGMAVADVNNYTPENLKQLIGEIQIRQQLEQERKQFEETKKLAVKYKIDISQLTPLEIMSQVEEEKRKRDLAELLELKKIASELKIGNPELVKTEYSLEQLRDLIFKRRKT